MTVDKKGPNATMKTIAIQEVHVMQGELSAKIEVYFIDSAESLELKETCESDFSRNEVLRLNCLKEKHM